MRVRTGAAPDLTGLRILLVEDEYLIAVELEEILSGLGGQVIGPVGDIEHALKVLDTVEFDAAVLDINLHERSVMPVAQTLRTHAVPFIYLSAYEQLPSTADLPAAPLVDKLAQREVLSVELVRALRSATQPG